MPAFIKWCRVAAAFVIGAGYAFGPDSFRQSPTLIYIEQGPLSIIGWGFVFMFCAVLMVTTKLVGFAATSAVWFVWGTCVAVAASHGAITAWGQIVWPFFFVAVNLHEVSMWSRRKAQLVREEGIDHFWTARQRSRDQDRG